MQAGVEVVGVLVRSKIRGYHVHASKIARLGVPILFGHTIKEAVGENSVEKAIVVKVDKNKKIIEGSDIKFDVDTICISVGLSPLVELLGQANCELKYVAELGGYVPVRDENYNTTNESIFVAGDITGIEEASAAMVEGYIAGLSASKYLGNIHENFDELIEEYRIQLKDLRSGPHSEAVTRGMNKLMEVAVNV